MEEDKYSKGKSWGKRLTFKAKVAIGMISVVSLLILLLVFTGGESKGPFVQRPKSADELRVPLEMVEEYRKAGRTVVTDTPGEPEMDGEEFGTGAYQRDPYTKHVIYDDRTHTLTYGYDKKKVPIKPKKRKAADVLKDTSDGKKGEEAREFTDVPIGPVAAPPEVYAKFVQYMPVVHVDILLVRESDGRVLLVQRHAEPAKGLYWYPGGRLLKGETFLEAAERTMRHRIGLQDFEIKQTLGTWNTQFLKSAWKGQSAQTVNILYLAHTSDKLAEERLPICGDAPGKCPNTGKYGKYKWVDVDIDGEDTYIMEGLKLLNQMAMLNDMMRRQAQDQQRQGVSLRPASRKGDTKGLTTPLGAGAGPLV